MKKMTRTGLLAAAGLLCIGSLSACKDDDHNLNPDPKPPVSCEEDPTQDKCDPGEVSCEEDPTQDKCQLDGTDAALLYLSDVTIAALDNGDATCCVDFDGDGALDNNVLVGLEKILRTLEEDGNVPGELPGAGSNIDVAQELTALFGGLIDDGSLTVLFQTDAFPNNLDKGGDFALDAYKGSSDSNAADRAAGEGVFELEDLLTTLQASLENGIVQANAESDVSIPWHIKLKHGPHVLGNLAIADLSVRLDVEHDANGKPQTTDATQDAEGNPVNYLAGAVRGESTVEAVNALVSGFCGVGDYLSFDQDPAVADGTQPVVQADPAVVTALENHSDSLCVGLGAYAVKTDSVARLFDVDTDGNGVNDAMSVGMNIRLVPGSEPTAELEEPTAFYLNGLRARGSDGAGNVPCCFDFTGDGAYDNGAVLGLERLVNLLGADFPNFAFDVEDESKARFDQIIEEGLLSLVVQVTPVSDSDDIHVEIFEATSDSDWFDRANGNGEFTLGQSLGAETATRTDNEINVSVDDIEIPWSIVLAGQRLDGVFNVSQGQLNLVLEEDANGELQPVLANVNANGDAVNFIAGVARASEVVAAVNDMIVVYCDVSGPYLSYAPAGTANVPPVISADATIAQELIAKGGICEGLGQYELEAYKIGSLFDIDRANDGHIDGLSVGFNLTLTNAAVVE